MVECALIAKKQEIRT